MLRKLVLITLVTVPLACDNNKAHSKKDKGADGGDHDKDHEHPHGDDDHHHHDDDKGHSHDKKGQHE